MESPDLTPPTESRTVARPGAAGGSPRSVKVAWAFQGASSLELRLQVAHDRYVACLEDENGDVGTVELIPSDRGGESRIVLSFPPAVRTARLLVADGDGIVDPALCCRIVLPAGHLQTLSRSDLAASTRRCQRQLRVRARRIDPAVDWVQRLIQGYVGALTTYVLAGVFLSRSVSTATRIQITRYLPQIAFLASIASSWSSLGELAEGYRKRLGFLPPWVLALLIAAVFVWAPIERRGHAREYFDQRIHVAAVMGVGFAILARTLVKRARNRRGLEQPLSTGGGKIAEKYLDVMELFKIRNPEYFFEKVDSILRDHMGADAYFFLTEDGPEGNYRHLRSTGMDGTGVESVSVNLDTSDLLGQIIRSNQPFGARDLERDSYLASGLKKTAVPVQLGMRVGLGKSNVALVISRFRRGGYDDADQEFLKALSFSMHMGWRLLESEAEKSEQNRARLRELTSLRKQTVILDRAESEAVEALQNARELMAGRKFTLALQALEGIKSLEEDVQREKYLLTMKTLLLLGDEIALERAVERPEFGDLPLPDRLAFSQELERIGFYRLALRVFSKLLDEAPEEPLISEAIDRLRTVIKEIGQGEGLLTLARKNLTEAFTELSLLGVGGSGFVCRAYWADRERHVAVKFLNPTQTIDEIQQARFDREVEILSSLSHPNIIGVYGKIPDTHPCFVMEYLSGQPLDRYISRRGRLTLAETRHIGLGLGEALRYIHELGVVHRDLKPGNAFVTDTGVIKLMDFGMVKILEDSSLTMTGDVIGTPAYMSPEQRMGVSTLSVSTDIYSFGVIVFEMLSGQRPFPDDKTVLDQIRLKAPDIGEIVPDVPPLLVAVIGRCLKARPEDRPQSVEGVLEALVELPEGEMRPVSEAGTIPVAGDFSL